MESDEKGASGLTLFQTASGWRHHLQIVGNAQLLRKRVQAQLEPPHYNLQQAFHGAFLQNAQFFRNCPTGVA